METFYLNGEEMSQAIAEYLVEHRNANIDNGIMHFKEVSDGLYKIEVHELVKAS